MDMTNLEPLCARYARLCFEVETKKNSVKTADKDNTITKALGVLVENGLYAMAVFLVTCKHHEFGKAILEGPLREMWTDKLKLITPAQGKKTDIFEAVQGITDNLEHLILCRKVTEQTLTFARYHAKAAGKGES